MAAIGWSRILTLPSETKGLTGEDGARYAEGFVSSMMLDRQREVVHQATLLRAYEARQGMPYLRDHNPEKAVGWTQEWEVWQDKVHVRNKLVPHSTEIERSPARLFADDLFDLLNIGTPVSQSIGFNPVDKADWSKSGEEVNGVWWWGGEKGMFDIEMLETSAVMIGANREADLHMAKGLGLSLDQPWTDDPALSKEQREDVRFTEDFTVAAGRIEAARNIVRHWVKEGRALSPEILDLLVNPMTMQAEILRAGRMLSDRNREAVQAAYDALGDLLRRDDESPARQPAEEVPGSTLGFLDYPVRARTSLFDQPVPR